MTRHLVSAVLFAALCCVGARESEGAQGLGAVTGTIRVTKDGKIERTADHVVVYLEDVPATPLDEKRPHVIRQHDQQFVPQLSVIVKGTTVDFPNDDKIFHNVFSQSRAKRFDLGLYRSGESKSVLFDRAGVVDVFCNIHPDMQSRILVVPTGHFAMTDERGAFRIDAIPPGTYPVVAWHAHGRETRGTVTVEPGKSATLALDVEDGPAPGPHRRKDGTPYGRYE